MAAQPQRSRPVSRVGGALRSLSERWRRLAVGLSLVQLAKTVAAAVLAWVLASEVWDLPQPFLAPWAALLVVHATVYRTFWEGGGQVAATVVGVLLAAGASTLLGVTPLALGAVVLVGLVLQVVPPVEESHAAAAAATAVIVLTTGGADNDVEMATRLLDTAVGIGTGVLVNLLVWPPLLTRTAVEALDTIDDRIGALLRRIADDLGPTLEPETVEAWVDETREIDEDIDRAYAMVRQAWESARLNPRRSARSLGDTPHWRDMLRRIEQAVADTRSMARTIERSASLARMWDEDFRARFAELLGRAGRAIESADPDPVRRMQDELETFVEELSHRDLSPGRWAEYGGLVVNLRNIVRAMDEVAAANPLVPQRRGPATTG